MRTMEHNTTHAPELTIFFGTISYVFKVIDTVVKTDSYVLLPLMHLVSIVAGICAIVSFVFVLHPPLKTKLAKWIEKTFVK